MNSLEIYERLVSQEGLFTKAFFGEKASRVERRKLNRLWHRALRLADGSRHEAS